MADVWFSWCKRRSKCNYCPDSILAGTPVVIVKHWRPNKHSYYFRFHPDCYIQQGVAYLAKHPYEPYRANTGRPKLELSNSDSYARIKLLRHRAVVMYRRRQAIKLLPSEAAQEYIDSLDKVLDKITEDIQIYGGVPNSWK